MRLSKEIRLGELYTLSLCLILIGMIIRVPYVNLILNVIGMLNMVISCVDYFKSDWHAKYGMIMYELYIPFLKFVVLGNFQN